MPEEWRPVVGWEGLYEVSSLGRVRSVAILRPSPGKYPRYSLNRDGKAKHVGAHQIVAAAFIGPAPEGQLVNHLDGDKWNASASNLEYATQSGNMRHARDTGLWRPHEPYGAQHPNAKLTEDTVREARRRHATGETYASIGRSMGVTWGAIRLAVLRKNWKRLA